jgi:hypothetical protein
MSSRSTLGIAASLCVTFLLVDQVLQAQQLSDSTYSKWRDHILPKADELAFERIPWKFSFWDGVIAAQKEDKPILLYMMTGHPCGAV